MSSFKKLMKKSAYYNSFINIIDSERVIIENCRSINECSDIMVSIGSAENDIEIWGSNLVVTCYTNTSIEVQGKIDNVSISKRRGAL